MVVPLRAGGGTRLKIFEAMAAGAPILSTTVGAEGLPVTHGRDIMLADTATEYADSLIALLRDRVLRARIAHDGVETARRFDWPVIAREFGAVLADVVTRHRTEPEAHQRRGFQVGAA